jgi:hypothetical protein
MNQPRIAFILIPPPDAFGLPIPQAHQFSRLHLAQLFAFDSRHDRHPLPFFPTHCQCLQVGQDGDRHPAPIGTFSLSSDI